VRDTAVQLLPDDAARARRRRGRRAGYVRHRGATDLRAAAAGPAAVLAVRGGAERVLPAAAGRQPARVHRGGVRRDRRSGRRGRRRGTGGPARAGARRARRGRADRAGSPRAAAAAGAERRRGGQRARDLTQPRARAAVPGPRPAGDLTWGIGGGQDRPAGLPGTGRDAPGLGRRADRADAQADQPARGAVRRLLGAAAAGGGRASAPPPHHGMPPAGAATPGVSGRANPALGRDGQLRTPRTGVTAQASVLPTASGGTGAGRPTAEVTGAPSSVAASSA